MQPLDIVHRLQQTPFQPFRVRTKDGRFYQIHEPRLVRITPTRLLIFFPDSRYPPPACSGSDVVALEDIDQLESLVTTS